MKVETDAVLIKPWTFRSSLVLELEDTFGIWRNPAGLKARANSPSVLVLL